MDDELFSRAEELVVKLDRSKYEPFLQQAEKYCKRNEALVGGKVGIDLLIHRPATKDSYFMDIYSFNPYATAKGIMESFSGITHHRLPYGLARMHTDIPYHDFSIYADERLIVQVHKVETYKGIPLMALIQPTVRTSYFSKEEVYCLSEELQIIDVYRQLYSPVYSSKWRDLVGVASSLFDIVEQTIDTKSQVIIGGEEREKKMEQVMVDHVLPDTDMVIVGDYALHALGMRDEPKRLQIISRTHPSLLVDKIKTILPGARLSVSSYSLNLPTDFQIMKYTIHKKQGERDVAVADVYNSSSFELIPFWRYGRLKVGNPYVLMRFKFIDIWNLRIIMNVVENKIAISARISEQVKSILSLRTYVQDLEKEDRSKLFQSTDYVGVSLSETVQKKKLIRSQNVRFQDHYLQLPQSSLSG